MYELNKGNLKLAYERETDAGIKCCTFGASSLEERHLVSSLFCFSVQRNMEHFMYSRPYVVRWSLVKSGSAVSASGVFVSEAR